jgi:UDP-N-acetylmuramoylalanine--D-glutamate ligase
VTYVNDSIATAPERALAAIAAYDEPLILLAGGRDKQMVWGEWTEQVAGRVRQVVLFGELGPMLEERLADVRSEVGDERRPVLVRVETLADAVAVAAASARIGDVVLLSPGGTSFDAFRDFEERGERFRALVKELATRMT